MEIARKIVDYHGRELSMAVKYTETSDEWLVFLHGLGCAKECFNEAFRRLARSYSVLTLDFVGFGESQKPHDFDYRLKSQADVTNRLIKQFDPQKVNLIAHSMGGAVGLLMTKELENLGSFINVEGNLIAEDAGIVSRDTVEQTESDFVIGGYDRFLNDLRSSKEPSFKAWGDWYEKAGQDAVYRSSRSLVNWSDSGKLLPHFNNLEKKAYIYGDQSANTPLLEQLDESVDVHIIPQSGHFMMRDNPSAFYDAVKKCL